MSDSLFLDPFATPPEGRLDASPAVEAGEGADEAVVLVAEIPLAADRAAEAFLEYVHLWWPVALKACGEDSHICFEEGALLEEGVAGDRRRWAEITHIDGPTVALRWFGIPQDSSPDDAAAPATDMAVDFTVESADRTSVGVRGSGPASLVEDWRSVLDGYARFTGGSVRTATT